MERINLTKRVIPAFLVAGALTLGACGGDSSPEVKLTPEEEAQKAIDGVPAIEAEYLPNGNRLLKYTNDRRYTDILQVCDGVDLLEQTARYSDAGQAPSRSVNHPACADGRLTPEDFQLPSPGTR